MTALTPGQRKVLLFIRAFLDAHGYPPVWREICEHLGASSTNTSHDYIRALERKGMLTYMKKRGRTLALTAAGLRIVAEMRAEMLAKEQCG